MKKMVSIALAALLAITALAGCGDTTTSEQTGPTGSSPTQQTLSGNVKTGGSTSVEKVMTALIYQFQDLNRDVTIDYEMNGSGDGIKNTISGMYEIGHSSRELKTDGSEDGLKATAYAIDGIAVVLHPGNGVESLTKEQIKDIYAGKITNWSEVGGADGLITVVVREASSGTRSAFAEIIGVETDDASTALVENATTCDSTGAVQTTVSQNQNAIGYMSFSDVDPAKVKTAEYDGVAISTETLKDGTYQLKREFWVLTKEGAALSPAAQGFIDFIMGEQGQQIVEDNSLLPVV